MAHTTIRIIYGDTPKKHGSNKINPPLNYCIETENNIFLYERKIVSNEPHEDLFKKIMPFIEDEFF